MAVPKRKTSKGAKNRRRSHLDSKVQPVQLIKCPNCGKNKKPHAECPNCGKY